jgi:SARP family transcriptional regulator, regulator of embCAB operon
MPQSVTLTRRNASQPTTARHSTDCALDCAGGCDKIPDHAVACINVDLLGGLSVRAGRTTMGPLDIGGGKLRRVLLALILHRGAPVSKDRLVSLLWEGSPPSGAKATLESYVCVLRKKLQSCHETRPSLITTAAGCYAIDMSRVDLDLVRYEHLMSAALHPDTSPADALPMLEAAMTLTEASLLPEELDSEWLDEVRRTHNQNVRENLIAAATKVTAMPSACAERWARLALEGDSLDESAWRALLGSLQARGQHADGLRAYDHCRKLFAAELGCAPGPGLQELYVQLLRGANEDDKDLSQLFDAVVRLHAASGPGLRPAMPTLVNHQAPGNERHDTNDHASSVEQARRTLTQLLRSVGSSHQRPNLALGA